MPYVNPKNPPEPVSPTIQKYRDGHLVVPAQQHNQPRNDSWEPDSEPSGE